MFDGVWEMINSLLIKDFIISVIFIIKSAIVPLAIFGGGVYIIRKISGR